MKAYVRKFISEVGDNKEANSFNVFNSETIQVVQHIINKESGIGINNTFSEEDKFPQENLYCVLSGKVHFVLENSNYVLDKNETILVTGYGSFSIWGLEDSVILCVTTNGNNLSNNIDEYGVMIHEAEEKDRYTKYHNMRVSKIAGKLYQTICPNKDISTIVTAGSFHDIGKTRIDGSILNKNGKLSPEEFEIIKMHPIYTKEILDGTLDDFTTKIASEHHERLDGSGYPYHLKGDELCVETRILGIADIFDALTSDRSYRNRFSLEDALNMMSEMEGKIDMNIFKVLIELIDKKVITYDEKNLGFC